MASDPEVSVGPTVDAKKSVLPADDQRPPSIQYVENPDLEPTPKVAISTILAVFVSLHSKNLSEMVIWAVLTNGLFLVVHGPDLRPRYRDRIYHAYPDSSADRHGFGRHREHRLDSW